MGKGGDSSRTAPAEKTEKQEVLIDGRYYDVSNMKHPGGNVIGFYAGKGIDASQAFTNFHLRSKKAKKYLDSLPSRSADAKQEAKKMLKGQADLLADFEEFTRELEAEGFFKPAPLHVAYRIFELIALYSIGFYFLKQGQFVLGIMFAGIAQGRCGWLMHEGGHNSLTGNITLDHAIQVVTYGVGCGMSGSWWRSQHNKHHAMPQKLGHDVDLNTLPLVAFTEKVCKRAGMAQKTWVRMQAFMFPVITTLLVALGWQYYLHPRHIIRRKHWAEGASLIARHAIWHYLITTQYGLAQSTLLYLAYDWFAANYIFINFAVSHTHLDVVPKEDTQVSYFCRLGPLPLRTLRILFFHRLVVSPHKSVLLFFSLSPSLPYCAVLLWCFAVFCCTAMLYCCCTAAVLLCCCYAAAVLCIRWTGCATQPSTR